MPGGKVTENIITGVSMAVISPFANGSASKPMKSR